MNEQTLPKAIHDKIDQLNGQMQTCPFDWEVPKIKEIKWNKGVAAGKCKWNKDKTITLAFNKTIALTNDTQAFINRTVVHEYAHAVDVATRGTSDHGPQWKSIMRYFGADPSRCHKFDVSKARTLPQKQVFCGCLIPVKVSVTIYKRMIQGKKYTCRTCKKTVTLSAETTCR